MNKKLLLKIQVVKKSLSNERLQQITYQCRWYWERLIDDISVPQTKWYDSARFILILRFI